MTATLTPTHSTVHPAHDDHDPRFDMDLADEVEVVDQLKALSENTANLERVVHDGLGSLLALARGDDYLLDVDAEV